MSHLHIVASQDLVDDNTFISEQSMQLMKFHGSYQQDHREKRAFGQGKFYQFMMRTRQPGGNVSNQLYLAMDELADQVDCDSVFCPFRTICQADLPPAICRT